MTDEVNDRDGMSDRRIGIIVVGVLLGLIAAGLVLASAVRGDPSGIVLEKKSEYVTCRDNGSRYNPRRVCSTNRCPRIEYVTDDGRHKGVCVTRKRFDAVRVGDRFHE